MGSSSRVMSASDTCLLVARFTATYEVHPRAGASSSAAGKRVTVLLADNGPTDRFSHIRVTIGIRYGESPEIVIEILSPSNSTAEMEEKRELYFARGAQEFWMCEREGSMRFFNSRGALSESVLVTAFPKRIDIDFA